MKSGIRVSVLSVFSLLLFTCVYGQNLDLIVTEKGDSIACRIDSIDEALIFYEMKSQGKWVQTFIKRSGVYEYKRNEIVEKEYKYVSGTSIIESLKPAPASSLREVQRNSIYAGILSMSYSRMIPLGDRLGITFSGGLNFVSALFDDGIGVMVESTLLTGGGTKHFFEPGLMGYFHADISGLIVRAGYRYQGTEGFLLRAGILISSFDGLGAGPSLSIGYSF